MKINPKMFHNDVIEAAMKGFEEAYEQSLNNEGEQDEPEQWMRAALASALTAWPGAFPWTFSGPLDGTAYVLPLNTENTNDPR